jgi:E3 Ubiquitin ligase
VRRDRLVADTPLVKIRSAAQGYVKIFGRATPAADPLPAPLSSRPCVWWSFEVAKKERNSKGETTWRSIESATSVHAFVLNDGDAECLVGPVNAEITPTAHDVWYGDLPRPVGLPPLSGSLLQTSNYRYTERLLNPGVQLSVLGELRSQSEIGSANAATAALLTKWKLDQPALLARFDTNHDGRLDGAEWEAARQAAAAEAQQQALQAPITRTSVIAEPTNGEPFLIAALDSAQLVRREKTRAILFFCLGVACVVLCAWAITNARD